MAEQLISTTVHEKLPDSYVRNEAERPRLDQVVADANIPVVDLANPDHAAVVSQIGAACSSHGFFQVLNHGLPVELMLAVMAVANDFFRLSPEEKAKLYSDDPAKKMRLSTSFNVRKETVHNWRDYLRLHCHPLEQFVPEWPANPPPFRDIMSEYCKEVRDLGFRLYAAISESLGLEEDYIKKVLGEQAPPPLKRGYRTQEQQEGPGGGSGAWCAGDGIRGVVRLEGHAKAVTGVAVPEGSGMLFSGSLDGTVRAWDCGTGKCVHVAPVHEGEVGRLIAMGPWVLVGVRGAVKALHTGSGKELQLHFPAGAAVRVTALLAEDDEHLFAGAEDGAIYIWRLDREHQRFDEVAALTRHERHPVTALAQRKGALYSGSVDGGIRAWDLQTHQCICSFAGHASRVTALLCWDRFLFSSSVDGTLKVWRSKPDHGDDDLELEVHYTHREDGQRVVSMDGTLDADKKPNLLIARGDGIVRVYDLPSFKTRGQIRCDGEVTAMSLRTPGVVFTGDESGEVRVAKWTTPVAAAEAQT